MSVPTLELFEQLDFAEQVTAGQLIALLGMMQEMDTGSLYDLKLKLSLHAARLEVERPELYWPQKAQFEYVARIIDATVAFRRALAV